MKSARFYEIPVAQPWTPDSGRTVYRNTIEQAVAADKLGCMHSGRWSTLSSASTATARTRRCSTTRSPRSPRNIPTGYGVRLMPTRYNHPVRTAEPMAVLDLISNGRVDFGTGRSSTRLELEGFGVDPKESKAMWQEATRHVVGCWTNDEYEFEGATWSMPKRRVLPTPMQQPHPPIFGATSSLEGHAQIGELGLSLCSFAVGQSPAQIKEGWTSTAMR